MAARPYWSGQIRLALVFLPVQVFTATRRTQQVPLHELSRKTGERIHHMNVTSDGKEISRDEMVKGFEVNKGEYVLLEQEEIEGVKLPSSDTLELVEFFDADKLPVIHFERPYFVMPHGKTGEEIYGVLRDALRETKKVGIGQITLRGREELCAVLPYKEGLILETLRYAKELHPAEEFFGELKDVKPNEEYVALAKQLIQQNTTKLDLERFHDHYHEAMQELIHAKTEHRKPDYKIEKPKSDNVVNLMDALKKSLRPEAAAVKKPAASKSAKKPLKKPAVKKTTGKKATSKRRSA